MQDKFSKMTRAGTPSQPLPDFPSMDAPSPSSSQTQEFERIFQQFDRKSIGHISWVLA